MVCRIPEMKIPFCYFLFLLSISSFGQKTSESAFLKIEDRLEERILDISQLEFYEDKQNILDFEDILKDSFQEKFMVKPEFS